MTHINLDTENASEESLQEKINYVQGCLETNNLKPLLEIGTKTFRFGERNIIGVELEGAEVIFSTYFCGRPDPQRNIFVQNDAYDYIKPLYESVHKLGLNCVIFHDGLSDGFVEKYSTSKTKFVQVELGNLSLNDERYFLYYEYLLRFGQNISHVIMSDVSDVIVNKDPFPLLAKHSQLLFTGRSNISLVKHNFVNYQRIKKLEEDAGIKIPANFYNMRIFNAGTIGGSKSAMIYLLRQMIGYFLSYDTNRNHNMTVFNLCIYRYWLEAPRLQSVSLIALRYSLLKIAMLVNEKAGINLLPDNVYCKNLTYQTAGLFAGFPFTSAFKKFETDSKAYLIHK